MGDDLRVRKLIDAVSRLGQSWRELDDRERLRDVEIGKEDAGLLQDLSQSLEGNPGSIRRFVNTYQLAKAIRADIERQRARLPDGGESPPLLADLATWLVLLQNWPYHGSCLHYHVLQGGEEHAGILAAVSASTKLPPRMRAFLSKHRPALERVARSEVGLDIAGCFSFVWPADDQAAREARDALLACDSEEEAEAVEVSAAS